MSRPGQPQELRRDIVRFVDRLATAIMTVIVDVLVLLMLVVLVWGVVALTIAILRTIDQRDIASIKDLVVGVLTVFVIIEIFDLFREYARSAHVKVTNLAEVSLAVVLRELWLLLLDGSTDAPLYLALAGLVAALAVFWYVAARQEAKPRQAALATGADGAGALAEDAGPQAEEGAGAPAGAAAAPQPEPASAGGPD